MTLYDFALFKGHFLLKEGFVKGQEVHGPWDSAWPRWSDINSEHTPKTFTLITHTCTMLIKDTCVPGEFLPRLFFFASVTPTSRPAAQRRLTGMKFIVNSRIPEALPFRSNKAIYASSSIRVRFRGRWRIIIGSIFSSSVRQVITLYTNMGRNPKKKR